MLVNEYVRKIVVYTLFLLVGQLAFGQGTVEGKVTDRNTGQPLQFTSVGIQGRAKGTVTDSEGGYRLTVSAKDTVVLIYSFVGYQPEERRLAVKGNMKLDVSLQPIAQQLEGVEIKDEKVRQSTFTQVDIQKLDDAVGPGGGVESVIKLLPDVQSNNELSSQYSVRGGSFDENLVYINGIEVFRPMLIRSAQQEGMSIINPDMVSYILFSPGGFDATYGDKMSSVLDITYSRPTEFGGKISASMLGGSAFVQGLVNERLSYAVGLRSHSNAYVLGSLDTKGRYTTNYTDLQALLHFRPKERLDFSVLTLWTHNVYRLVPESQTTTFGGFFMPLSLRVYFDGLEEDSYHTFLGAVTANYRPSEDWRLSMSLAGQHVAEEENYDVQSQYFLYELAMGETAGDTVMFDRGVGTFLEHARNRLTTDIASLNMNAVRYARLGSWQAGVRLQTERIVDHLREWKWVDSAGYSLPAVFTPMGDSTNMPVSAVLQNFANAENAMTSIRGGGYLQRDVSFSIASGAEIKLVAGLRGQFYGVRQNDWHNHTLLSPRFSASLKPKTKHDILFRLAAGIYQQAPFYREYRRDDGTLIDDLDPQSSKQVMATTDWRFRMWNRPFTFTADLYYKYITNLIPYTIDNLRLRYHPDLDAVGYATGISLRLNGELIDGLESWASLSFMRTQEDIKGDGLGWLARPTDQRFSFKLLLQDNLPQMPWWRMSLNMVFGSGTPVARYGANEYRLPAYYRVDWGNTLQLSQITSLKHSRFFNHIHDLQIGVEVFNLFNFRNVVSYLWVADYSNVYYPVPNYLTARQLNVKVTILF